LGYPVLARSRTSSPLPRAVRPCHRQTESGFETWRAEGWPTENDKPEGYPPATFVAASRPGLFVDNAAVLGAVGQPGTVIVNGLGDDLYKGIGPSRYGRPGARAHSRQRTGLGRHSGRSGRPGLADAQAKFAAKGVTPGHARLRLMRRRHFGDHRPVSAATARLRRHHTV